MRRRPCLRPRFLAVAFTIVFGVLFVIVVTDFFSSLCVRFGGLADFAGERSLIGEAGEGLSDLTFRVLNTRTGAGTFFSLVGCMPLGSIFLGGILSLKKMDVDSQYGENLKEYRS